MRAALLHEPGSPPELGDHPVPASAPGHTLVRVTAAPVVPLDLLCASGASYFGRPATPYVPGVQGVGVTQDGRRVFFATSAGMAPGDGSMAEHCLVPDAAVTPVDADVDDAALAALGLSAVAAWMCLTWRGRLQPGERVVVLGAGGAVGQAGVAAAKALGAAAVVGACRSEAGLERARATGADAVVDTTGDGLAERLTEACGGPVDVVLDPVFGPVTEAALPALAPGGRLVNLGGSAGDTASLSSALLRSRSIDVLGYTNNALSPAQRTEALLAVADLAARGRMHVAHTTHALADVATAWGATGTRAVLVP